MRAQRGQGDGTCANPDEKEDVCRAGEEGERKERMTTSEFLSVGWQPPAAGSLFPKPCAHIHSGTCFCRSFRNLGPDLISLLEGLGEGTT